VAQAPIFAARNVRSWQGIWPGEAISPGLFSLEGTTLLEALKEKRSGAAIKDLRKGAQFPWNRRFFVLSKIWVDLLFLLS
jgi:hypothetical protein